MSAPRHRAALAYLGRRYAQRGGFLTPSDYRIAAVMFSESSQECADLERWLVYQEQAFQCEHPAPPAHNCRARSS